MEWVALISALVPLLQSFRGSLATPAPNIVSVRADQAVKDLQRFLNSALTLNPPLAVDGWLGPKTDAAIEQGLAKLRSYGIGAQ